MKLIKIVIIAALIGVFGWANGLWGQISASRGSQLQLAAESAVLLDASTGEWLYVHNAQEPLPPASMSKMMTELLVLDAIEQGKIHWEDKVTISAYAAGVNGASMQLLSGQSVGVRQLFEAMAIHSANDASVALAEFTAGSEAEFVEQMNARANKIGLSDETHFANATGLSSRDLDSYATAAADGETIMTAKDVALLARHLIKSHPEVLKVTKKSSAGGGSKAANLRTTNEMLPGQRFGTKGNDGLKTGYTQKAGYCFTGTTVRNGKRYITVVMGTDTPEARFEETKKLLAYGEAKS
ncbi:D-alanyl-D-alanine carboxypeptidase family protein [Cohnella kolymensis]|uniref:D-alanyl-D-alanine carboxypeptidase family protein n=1 Tax=Cohnella kolymensis TaxID=1590652 RepID=UPI000AA5A751|nr:D-alanyl-D-alanine carboxypeptidase family protein [Cohnella kolymensis]